MRIACVGDCLLDVEIVSAVSGPMCPENTTIPVLKGNRVNVMAGGAGNVANILRDMKCTVDLYTDGPGQADRAWIGDLAKRACKANRIVWSNRGSVSLKMRSVGPDNQVLARMDSDAEPHSTGTFQGLYGLLDDIDRYDCVVISDYAKTVVNPDTEQVIVDILKAAKHSVVDSKRKDYALWKNAEAITPNHLEAMSIYGSGCPVEIMEMVGCKSVFITCGKKPVLMACGDGMEEIPVTGDVSNVYCVGAGDSFVAGLAVALAQGKSYLEAGQAGVELAQKYVARPRKTNLR